jgi:hypothetical protein
LKKGLNYFKTPKDLQSCKSGQRTTGQNQSADPQMKQNRASAKEK